MSNITIDLFTFPIWLTFGLAVVLLRSVTSSRIRPLLFTAINIGFVTLILRHHSIFIVVGLLFFWILVKLIATRKLKKAIILILGGLAVLGFILMRIAQPGIKAHAMQGGERRGGALLVVLTATALALGYYWYRRYN